MSLLGRKLTVPGGYHPWWTLKKKNKKPKKVTGQKIWILATQFFSTELASTRIMWIEEELRARGNC